MGEEISSYDTIDISAESPAPKLDLDKIETWAKAERRGAMRDAMLALVARARGAERLEEENAHLRSVPGANARIRRRMRRAANASSEKAIEALNREIGKSRTEAARLRAELATAARMRDCMPMGAEGLLVTQEHYDGLAKQADDLCNFYNDMFIALGFDRPQPEADLVAAVTRLRTVVEKLRKGLEPFAEWLPCNHEQFDPRNTFEIEPEIIDLRVAARLLAETAPDVPADQDGRAG